jgi:hypothetical protein
VRKPTGNSGLREALREQLDDLEVLSAVQDTVKIQDRAGSKRGRHFFNDVSDFHELIEPLTLGPLVIRFDAVRLFDQGPDVSGIAVECLM